MYIPWRMEVWRRMDPSYMVALPSLCILPSFHFPPPNQPVQLRCSGRQSTLLTSTVPRRQHLVASDWLVYTNLIIFFILFTPSPPWLSLALTDHSASLPTTYCHAGLSRALSHRVLLSRTHPTCLTYAVMVASEWFQLIYIYTYISIYIHLPVLLLLCFTYSNLDLIHGSSIPPSLLIARAVNELPLIPSTRLRSRHFSFLNGRGVDQ